MNREPQTIRPAVAVPLPLAAACDCELSFTTGGDAEWFAQSTEYYVDNPDVHRDQAQSGAISGGQETWMQTTVEGPGNVSFRYKMASAYGDALYFYIDTSMQAYWTQGSTWPWTGNFAVPSGTHTLKWRYVKDAGYNDGTCWVDYIQWSGGVPESGGGADWEQITYTYDPAGRRIAKDVDGTVTRYVYDGDQCIAEYDGSDVQLRKYVYGPGIDQPICMIEVADANAAYFYHYDGLGSVVALSDAAGDTVQVYEYDVYGQVAASDPNHTNPFLFTGRRFDTETGLYYYRARYYNPTIGRFLQTDPIGYTGGMNLYWYCRNNPWNMVDPFGTDAFGTDPCSNGGGNDVSSSSSDGSCSGGSCVPCDLICSILDANSAFEMLLDAYLGDEDCTGGGGGGGPIMVEPSVLIDAALRATQAAVQAKYGRAAGSAVSMANTAYSTCECLLGVGKAINAQQQKQEDYLDPLPETFGLEMKAQWLRTRGDFRKPGCSALESMRDLFDAANY